MCFFKKCIVGDGYQVKRLPQWVNMLPKTCRPHAAAPRLIDSLTWGLVCVSVGSDCWVRLCHHTSASPGNRHSAGTQLIPRQGLQGSLQSSLSSAVLFQQPGGPFLGYPIAGAPCLTGPLQEGTGHACHNPAPSTAFRDQITSTQCVLLASDQM